MTDDQLLQRLSSDNSELKVIIAEVRHKNKFLYDYNNLLIAENERLKEENKAFVDIEKAGYVKRSTHNKALQNADNFIKLYWQKKDECEKLKQEILELS